MIAPTALFARDTFVLTTVGCGGAGGAGGAAADAGKVIDPMTYIAKGAGAVLSKIDNMTKGVKGISNTEIPRVI
ncbi:hypothetical protein ACWD6R_01430 [Streptomyces sp. NPDC005151]